MVQYCKEKPLQMDADKWVPAQRWNFRGTICRSVFINISWYSGVNYVKVFFKKKMKNFV